MKFRNFLLFALIGLFLINIVIADQEICIDFDPPSSPSNLILTESNGNIQLTWAAATDIPDCSGISHYDIYKNSAFLISVEETNYLDKDLLDGVYTYTIYPWDLAKHEGIGISSKPITIGDNGNGGDTSGRRGGGPSSYWECGEWSECINETQERTCVDIGGISSDRTETRDCFPEFIPTWQEPEENETITVTTTPSGFFATITGAVVGTLGTGGTIVASIFVIAIVALAIVFGVKGRKK